MKIDITKVSYIPEQVMLLKQCAGILTEEEYAALFDQILFNILQSSAIKTEEQQQKLSLMEARLKKGQRK